jgi:hypothetical protein
MISKEALFQVQHEKSLLERSIQKNNSQIKNCEIILSKRGLRVVPHTLSSSATSASPSPSTITPNVLFSSSQNTKPNTTPVKKVSTEPLQNRIKQIISDSIRRRVHIGGGYKKSRKLKLNRNKMSRKYNKISRKYNKMSRKSKTNK